MERMYQRFRCDLSCEIRDRHRSYVGRVKNISVAGCFIETDMSPVARSKVEVYIHAAGDIARSAVRAVVVHGGYLRPRRADASPLLGLGVQVVQADEAYLALVVREAEAAARRGA